MAGLYDFLFGQKVLKNAAGDGRLAADQTPVAPGQGDAARNAAYAAQKLSQIQPGNLDLNTLPVLKNQDGSLRNRTMVVPDGKGNSVIIPLVGPQGQSLTPQDAMKFYLGAGKHLGVFKTPESAAAYQQVLK